mmetsp:Transcript_55119/g.124622  ORF Transcript_55119/g.124622 Transcript_55119/m.124622 type:complete len:243 (+) Transcript_55119:586-1314(+)
MWVGALARESVVHPLSEEAAVQLHVAAMRFRHLLEAAKERRRKVPRGRYGRRRQRGHKLGQARGFCRRGGDLALQVPHEVFALVAATDRVEAGGLQAVGSGADVVGHDHHGPLWIGLVERPEIAEVADLLREFPMAVEGLLVEFRQRHASGLLALDFEERGLEAAALAVIQAVEALAHQLSGAPGRWEGRAVDARLGEMALLDLAQPELHVGPARVLVGPSLQAHHSLLWRLRRGEVPRPEI